MLRTKNAKTIQKNETTQYKQNKQLPFFIVMFSWVISAIQNNAKIYIPNCFVLSVIRAKFNKNLKHPFASIKYLHNKSETKKITIVNLKFLHNIV